MGIFDDPLGTAQEWLESTSPTQIGLGQLAGVTEAETGLETDFTQWDSDVWAAKAEGIVSGYAAGGWVGAIVGSSIGTVGALQAEVEEDKKEAAIESARVAARGVATAKQAISGIAADRARREIVKSAARERASVVSSATASGVKGSGLEGGKASIGSQLQGELGFESAQQQLAKRAGIFEDQAKRSEDRANRAEEKRQETLAFADVALQTYSVFGGSSESSGVDS